MRRSCAPQAARRGAEEQDDGYHNYFGVLAQLAFDRAKQLKTVRSDDRSYEKTKGTSLGNAVDLMIDGIVRNANLSHDQSATAALIAGFNGAVADFAQAMAALQPSAARSS